MNARVATVVVPLQKAPVQDDVNSESSSVDSGEAAEVEVEVEDPGSYSDSSTAETVEVVDSDPDAGSGDITFNIACIFVLSMIVGLLIFHSLSRRWHA